MVRVSYPIVLSDRFKITPSLLPILHLGKDKFTDSQRVEHVIDGSGGLTLHDLAAEYEISAERVRQIEVAAMKKMKKTLAEFA